LSFLLDTNIISQLAKDTPNASVLRWLAFAADEEYLSVISLQEIREGIELLPVGKRRRALELWLEDGLLGHYADHIVPVSIAIAQRCGRLVGSERRKGFQADLADAYIAATALEHGLTLATLNRKHFERFQLKLIQF
jgi:predicted nucleic acid-binding protein